VLFQDLRYALRQLRKNPGFTALAVGTLALGLGASSAIFCLMDGVWLHPIRVPHSGELVRVFSTTEQDAEGLFTYSEYHALAERVTALKSTVALAAGQPDAARRRHRGAAADKCGFNKLL